ncbi:MAG: anti-sigma F factor [Clostridia bacterium]|nr:anti-sigma F factor [Clostridia bacterium]
MKSKPLNELKLELEAKSINEGYARYAVSAFLAPLDPSVSEIADIRTVVSEAVTNCIVHAYKEGSGKIYIRVTWDAKRCVRIRIKDHGCGIADPERSMQPAWTSDPAGERGGMGFTIMESFTDKMIVKTALGKGTSVTLVKRLS